MFGPLSPSAHASRGFEYVLASGTWSPSANLFSIGGFSQKTNAAGGVAQDFGAGGRIWFSGDALHYLPLSSDFTYGLQGTPAMGGALGGTNVQSILVDLDDDISQVDKFLIGDVAISCPGGSGENGFAIDAPTLSPGALALLALGLGLAGWILLRARRVLSPRR